MRIIPVIDLLAGGVVRGIAGRRPEYRPLVSQLASEPTPAAVASAFAQRGFQQTYVADLDAIAGREPDFKAYEAMRAAGLKLWIDAGTGNAEAAEKIHAHLEESDTLIVGLETLESCDALSSILKRASPERILFSLDLRQGIPITRNSAWNGATAEAIAGEILASGVQRLIVLDLADVGMRGGTGTLELLKGLRATYPHLEMIAGGGVRCNEDILRLEAAGANAALVASALHDGLLK